MYNREQKYTVEEYWTLVESASDCKYEYIDGYVRLMTGGTLVSDRESASEAANHFLMLSIPNRIPACFWS
jgi:hypothetical protein